MSLVVNNNMMAANTARNLNAHYGRLATSTQRLSSGLRVNSAADDAAGLAIRELQRADIAALQQGARNANDAISMIQVADGSLGIIDEKLIRMKELAEQAATGTYDSTQRLMIESEYQAMASEITRIANATDFNGTKLLDGTLAGDHDGSGLISEGKMKIHFGTGNDSAEDYYYVEIGECTSEALGLGNNSTWQDVQRRAGAAFRDSLMKQIKNSDLSAQDKAKMLAAIGDVVDSVDAAITGAVDYRNAYDLWTAPDSTKPAKPDGYELADDEGFLFDGKKWVGNSDLMDKYIAAGGGATMDEINAMAATTAPTAEQLAQDAQGILDSITNGIKTGYNTEEANTPAASDTDVITDLKNAIASAIAASDTAHKDFATTAATLKTELEGLVDAHAGKLYDTATNSVITDEVNKVLDELTAKVNEKAYQDAAVQVAKDEAAANIPAENETQMTQAIKDAFSDNFDTTTVPTSTADSDARVDAAIAAAVQKAKELGLDDAAAQKIGDDIKVKFPVGTDMTNGGGNWATGYPAAVTDGANGVIDDTDAQNAIKAAVANNTAVKQEIDDAKVDLNAAAGEGTLEAFWNSLRTTEKQKLQYAWGQAAIYNLANADPTNEPPSYGLDATIVSLADTKGISKEAEDAAKEMMAKALKDMHTKVGHMDFAGHTVETQEDAQMALDAINEAIISKDKIRAHLGAAQNRLENTVSNLNIQAENLQAAESRISDVDVATEMTQFVRNQILTQSAVAMLSQANSLPQMAMQLIGG